MATFEVTLSVLLDAETETEAKSFIKDHIEGMDYDIIDIEEQVSDVGGEEEDEDEEEEDKEDEEVV
jgi:hypothetical protein